MKVRVAVVGTVNKTVLIETDPRATFEDNIYLPTGVVANPTNMREYLGIGSGGTLRHRDLQGLRLGDDHPQYPLWNGRETINGQWDFTKPIWMADGSAALPALTWTLDTNLGIYRIGADNMGMTTGGTLRWDINTARTYQSIPIHVELTVPDNTKLPMLLMLGNSIDLADNGVIEFSRHVSSATNRGFQFGIWDDVPGGLSNLPPASAGTGFRWRSDNPSTINQPDLIFYSHASSTTGTEIYRHRYNLAQMLFVAGTQAAPTVAVHGFNHGMYYDTGNNRLAFSISGAGNLAVGSDHIRIVPQIRINTGSASAPAYSIQDDVNTGAYGVAPDQFGIATGGTLRWDVSTTAITSTLPNLGPAGSASAPTWSYSGDPNTGAYNSAANTWAIATDGTLRWSISTTAVTSTLPYLAPDGTASAPSFSYANDTNSGGFRVSADIIAWATGGSERFRIADAGQIGLGGANYGDAGQVLTSNGASAAPTWEDATGGGGGSSLVYVNTSVPGGNTIANTAADTAFNSSYDIPANTLQQGTVIRVKLFGVFSTTGTPTLRIRIKLDATTYIDTTAIVTPSGAANLGFSAEAMLVCYTDGATGTVEAQGVARIGTAATTSQVIPTTSTATITTDTTQILSLTATAQWGAADPANTITLREMAVWIEEAAAPAGAAPATATYLTEADETASLPNSLQLVAGTNVTFDTSTPNQLEISASGSSLSAAILADSPTAFWKLDEASGTFADSSGNGYTLTGAGTTTYQYSPLIPTIPDTLFLRLPSGANSASAVTKLGTTPPLTGDYTMECVVVCFSLGGNAYRPFELRGSGETEANNSQAGLLILATGSLIAAWEQGAGAGVAVVSGLTVRVGVPYHFVVVKDGTANTVTFYVNGIKFSVVSYSTEPTGGSGTLSASIGENAEGEDNGDMIIGYVAFYAGVKLTAAQAGRHAAAAGLFGGS